MYKSTSSFSTGVPSKKIFFSGACFLEHMLDSLSTINVDIYPEMSHLYIDQNESRKAGSFWLKSVLAMSEEEREKISSIIKNHSVDDYRSNILDDCWDYVILGLTDDFTYPVTIWKETGYGFSIDPLTLLNPPDSWDDEKPFLMTDREKVFDSLFEVREPYLEEVVDNLRFICNKLPLKTKIILCKIPLVGEKEQIVSEIRYRRGRMMNQAIDIVASAYDNVYVFDFGTVIKESSQCLDGVFHWKPEVYTEVCASLYSTLSSTFTPAKLIDCVYCSKNDASDLSPFTLKLSGYNVVGTIFIEKDYCKSVLPLKNELYKMPIIVDLNAVSPEDLNNYHISTKKIIGIKKAYYSHLEKYIDKKDPTVLIRLTELYLSSNKIMHDVKLATHCAELSASRSFYGKLDYVRLALMNSANQSFKLEEYLTYLVSNGCSRAMSIMRIAMKSQWKALLANCDEFTQESILRMLYFNNMPFKDIKLLMRENQTPYCRYIFSKIYSEGKIVDQDLNKSLELASSLNDTPSFEILSYLLDFYYEHGYYDNINQLCTSIVEKNIKEGYIVVARAYRHGKGVLSNIEKSKKWYELAVNNNPVHSLTEYAYYLLNIGDSDLIVKVNRYITKYPTYKWELKGILGLAFLHGITVKKDVARAIELFEEISLQDIKWSHNLIDALAQLD